MDQQISDTVKPQKKSNRPIIAFLLSSSSIFFFCISFIVNNPNGFNAFMENNPLWYIAQALMCITALLSLIGSILGILSLRGNIANRNISIASIVIGIPLFILATLIFGYVMVFIGIFYLFSP